MQNKWIWGGAGVLVIVIGTALFLFNGGANGLSVMGNTSLKELLSSNKSQKCSFSNAQSSGTIYVGSGRLRGDFTSKAGEGSAQSHMIIANDLAYVWIDGISDGYRMGIDDLKPGTNNSSAGIDADAKVANNCSPWQAAEASFTLPADVNFNAIPTGV